MALGVGVFHRTCDLMTCHPQMTADEMAAHLEVPVATVEEMARIIKVRLPLTWANWTGKNE
jgi:hypothetical protein